MTIPKSLYQFRGLPSYYHGLAYADTKLPEVKAKQLSEKIAKAPASGVLLVSGCAGPIANQLMALDKKVSGLSFVAYYESRLSDDDTLPLPQSPVVVVYGVGSEPAKNAEYSMRLLNAIISSYRSSETLLIIETDMTPANFLTRYGITIKNSLSLALKEEEPWI